MSHYGCRNTKINEESIEENVKSLIRKLEQNEMEIEEYTISQIRRALSNYTQMINEHKNNKISDNKKRTIKVFIKQALSSLDQVSIRKEEFDSSIIPNEKTWQMQLTKTERCMEIVTKNLQHNKIKESEYEHYLKIIKCSSQQLDNVSEFVEEDNLTDARNAISLLFLELFIRMPPKSKDSGARKLSNQDDKDTAKMFSLSDCDDIQEFFNDVKMEGKKHLSNIEEQSISCRSIPPDYSVNNNFNCNDNARNTNVTEIKASGYKNPNFLHELNAKLLSNQKTAKGRNSQNNIKESEISVNYPEENENPEILNKSYIKRCLPPTPPNKPGKIGATFLHELSAKLLSNQKTAKERNSQNNVKESEISVNYPEENENPEILNKSYIKRCLPPTPPNKSGKSGATFLHELSAKLLSNQKTAKERNSQNNVKESEISVNYPEENENPEILNKSYIKRCLPPTPPNKSGKSGATFLHEPSAKLLSNQKTAKERNSQNNVNESETPLNYPEENENSESVDKSCIKQLNKYKREAHQFSYPLSSNTYQRKRKEIAILLKKVEYINHKEDIYKILEILETKAVENEDISHCLDSLEIIDRDISDISKCDLLSHEKIHLLNECRKKIDLINSSNEEVSSERRELSKKINNIEETIKDDKETECSINISSLKKFF